LPHLHERQEQRRGVELRGARGVARPCCFRCHHGVELCGRREGRAQGGRGNPDSGQSSRDREGPEGAPASAQRAHGWPPWPPSATGCWQGRRSVGPGKSSAPDLGEENFPALLRQSRELNAAWEASPAVAAVVAEKDER
jgi:hypothetical protein